jgi:hypothetical protein
MHKILQLILIFSLISCVLFVNNIQSYAQAYTFNQNLVILDQTFYTLPNNFNSVNSIQKYLESVGSVLANYKVLVSFESDDLILKPNITFPSVSDEFFLPTENLKNYLNTEISVSEFVWKLSRTEFGNTCGSYSFDGKNGLLNQVCYNNILEPINPGVILAMIQKESRLVYGACAKIDADTNPNCSYSNPNSIQKLNFRLDRAVGYYCFETSDKTKGCWDENPKWRFFKGFFRQIYFMIRVVRIREKTCKLGGNYAFVNNQGSHIVANNYIYSGKNVNYGNGLTCSLYIYTPNINDKQLLWNVMKDMGVMVNYRHSQNLPEDYDPEILDLYPLQ